MLRLIQLTPPGRGAIATLRIEGPRAAELLATRISTRSGLSLTDLPNDRLVVGRFGGPQGEEIVVRRISTEAAELHCHGGLATVTRIEQALADCCQLVPWKTWTELHAGDPIAAAAQMALAEARTERTAAILLDQYRGALRRVIEEIQSDLTAQRPASARQKIDALLARAAVGLHLVRPWRVVIGGQPNVGKSSLINALVGYRRAIVHPTAGTTRDAVIVETAIDGWPVQLSDTAGLRDASDPVERAGVDLARGRLETADLTILVFDRSAAWSAADASLAASYRGALLVHNKADLVPTDDADDRPEGPVLSAITLQGLEVLCEAISQRLVSEPPPPGAAVPFTAEQIEQIAEYGKRLG